MWWTLNNLFLYCQLNDTESQSNNLYSVILIPTSSSNSLFSVSAGRSLNSIVPPGKSNFLSYGPPYFLLRVFDHS